MGVVFVGLSLSFALMFLIKVAQGEPVLIGKFYYRNSQHVVFQIPPLYATWLSHWPITVFAQVSPIVNSTAGRQKLCCPSCWCPGRKPSLSLPWWTHPELGSVRQPSLFQIKSGAKFQSIFRSEEFFPLCVWCGSSWFSGLGQTENYFGAI